MAGKNVIFGSKKPKSDRLLDPLSEESAKAEDQFYSEVARLFDDLPEPKPELKAFQKKIIQACRAKLIHGDKPTGI